jgi:hypothetical protein
MKRIDFPLTAYTLHPNTKESDELDEVAHIVEGERDGFKFKTYIQAKDPADAIEKYHRLIDKEKKNVISNIRVAHRG